MIARNTKREKIMAEKKENGRQMFFMIARRVLK